MYTESYNSSPQVAYEGMIATMDADIISATVQGAAIGFGKFVTDGSSAFTIKSDLSAATKIEGITVRNQAIKAESINAYPVGDTASIMREGSIWVVVSGNVAANGDVWLNKATGAISAADVGGGNGLKLPGCKWETAATNGGLARLRVNLEVPAIAGAA